MNSGEEKFAQTQPLAEKNDANNISREAGLEMNDVDKLGEEAGLEMADGEELGLKAKLEERDDSRLDLDNAPKPQSFGFTWEIDGLVKLCWLQLNTFQFCIHPYTSRRRCLTARGRKASKFLLATIGGIRPVEPKGSAPL